MIDSLLDFPRFNLHYSCSINDFELVRWMRMVNKLRGHGYPKFDDFSLIYGFGNYVPSIQTMKLVLNMVCHMV